MVRPKRKAAEVPPGHYAYEGLTLHLQLLGDEEPAARNAGVIREDAEESPVDIDSASDYGISNDTSSCSSSQSDQEGVVMSEINEDLNHHQHGHSANDDPTQEEPNGTLDIAEKCHREQDDKLYAQAVSQLDTPENRRRREEVVILEKQARKETKKQQDT